MNFIRFSLFVCALIAHCQSLDLYSDICYGDLGCFTTRPPFSTSLARPIALLPQSPEQVGAKFLLYTRANPTTPSAMTHDVANSFYKSTSETKIIIHGFLDHGYNKHITDTKDALLRVGDYNVIIVDWSKGNGFPYTQATANTQMVGALTARLVNSLIQRYSIKADKFHIIGHSLGAQTAGYAGERIPNLGRITGLDPAGPYFENTDKVVRLDETDAKFVDVIHTDGTNLLKLGLGMMQRSGHVDFYLNGGKDQPGCPQTSGKYLTGIFNLATVDVQGFLEDTICSHLVAFYYFRDSIENSQCQYNAFPCNSQDDFNSGKCVTCSAKGCNKVGFKASPNNDLGALYINTKNARTLPYCEHHLSVTLNSNSLSGQNQARGEFSIVLKGNLTSSLPIVLDNSDTTFKAGSNELRLASSTKFIGQELVEVSLKYVKTSNLLSSFLYQNEWSFRNIEIRYGDNQKLYRFCPTTPFITSGNSVTFTKC